MRNDIHEDLKDAQEIAKQKREQRLSREKMGTWEFGKGIKKEKDSTTSVRDKV